MSRAANHRHNARRDANESEIVEALQWQGALVTRLNGAGVPDLLCGMGGRLFLLEVKNPATRWRLTPEESAWHAAWEGYPVAVVQTPQEAIDALVSAVCEVARPMCRAFVMPTPGNWFGV